MRFAEHGGKRQHEDFVVEIVADMQRPVAPVFRAVRIYQRLHDTGGVLARLGKVSDGGAALVDAYALGIGVVEKDSGHVRLPRLRLTLKNSRRKTDLIFGEIADGILRGCDLRWNQPENLSENLSMRACGTRLSVRPFHQEAATGECCGVDWWSSGRTT